MEDDLGRCEKKISTETVAELERKIKERKQLLTKIIAFALVVAKELGTYTVNVGKWNTNEIRRLDNFNGFSFLTDTGQAEMGGNDVVIWYHPHDLEGIHRIENRILSVYFQTINQYEVHAFFLDPVEHSDLWYMIDHRDEVIEAYREHQKILQSKVETAAALIGRFGALETEARKSYLYCIETHMVYS